MKNSIIIPWARALAFLLHILVALNIGVMVAGMSGALDLSETEYAVLFAGTIHGEVVAVVIGLLATIAQAQVLGSTDSEDGPKVKGGRREVSNGNREALDTAMPDNFEEWAAERRTHSCV